MERIDWRRVAEPQSDAYDSRVILSFRPPHTARPDQNVASKSHSVSVRPITHWDPGRFLGLTPDHPNIVAGFDLLKMWRDGFENVEMLLDTIYAALDIQWNGSSWGCCSGPGPDGFGSVAVTANNAVGFAEGVVHELAHHKLRALGIQVERANRLITNVQSEMFRSPIRYDILRPMAAIVHAQYSYMHVAELDLKIIENCRNSELGESVIRFSLFQYLPKLAFGIDIITKNVKTDSAGDAFCSGLVTWCSSLLARGQQALALAGLSLQSFTHPLDAPLFAISDAG